MAKGIYVGVGGVAHKAKKIYVGAGGVAHKVKKIYVGIDGVARLAWSGEVPAGSVTFTSSQTWTVPEGVHTVDVFCVGGGAAGMQGWSGGASSVNNWAYAGDGGCGGKTTTALQVSVAPGQQIAVVVGAGMAVTGEYSGTYYAGSSSFGSITAAGAIQYGINDNNSGVGGSGGGEGGRYYEYDYDINARNGKGGNGGSNGSDGYRVRSLFTFAEAKGQGTTTRAFGDASGTLYAGGGAGGGSIDRDSQGAALENIGTGGDGGGAANTGGGGTGASYYYSDSAKEPRLCGWASGGFSGIVIVRWAAQ